MNDIFPVPSDEEAYVSAVCRMWKNNGFMRYSMTKFEEYDTYVKNKDFLVSENVLTFHDTDGRLLALKPDVTMSIIKNSPVSPDECRKVFYTENVYRVTKESMGYREILQSGIECFGRIDLLCAAQCVLLAAESLRLTGRSYLLEISDMAVLTFALHAAGVPENAENEFIAAIGEKNLSALEECCERCGVAPEKKETLMRLPGLSGSGDAVIPSLRSLFPGCEAVDHLDRLWNVIKTAGDRDRIIFDFSAVGAVRYYNGIMINGYIEGLPAAVLSGGKYD